MDGIDAVLVQIDENFKFEILKTHSLDYPAKIKIMPVQRISAF